MGKNNQKKQKSLRFSQYINLADNRVNQETSLPDLKS